VGRFAITDDSDPFLEANSPLWRTGLALVLLATCGCFFGLILFFKALMASGAI
jgi:hypothetical protein